MFALPAFLLAQPPLLRFALSFLHEREPQRSPDTGAYILAFLILHYVVRPSHSNIVPSMSKEK